MIKPSVLAVVPARGGSKGIPNKNITICGNHPLIYWTLKAINESELIDRTYISTDSPRIRDYCQTQGFDVPVLRPYHLSLDTSSAHEVIDHALTTLYSMDKYIPDYIILLQPTSPFRTFRHIDEAISLILSNQDAHSLVSVTEVPHNCVPSSIMLHLDNRLLPYVNSEERSQLRQLKSTYYARNGAAIYLFKFSIFRDSGSIYGDYVIPYFMSPEDSIDIDTPFDLLLANLLFNHRFHLENA